MNEQKKPRFILVDPSAVHTGGHHYEYAARILKIAAARGYTPELWANRKSVLPQDDFKVVPLLRNTFYENFQSPRSLQVLKEVQNLSLLHSFLQRARQKISNMLLPFFMETRMGLDAARAWHDARGNKFTPSYGSPQNKLKTSTFFYSLWFLLFKAIGVLKRIAKEPSFKKFLKLVLFLAAIALSPVLLVCGVFAALWVFCKLQRRPADQILANDMARGLRDGTWSKDDIVFIPTCFTTEIKGLGVVLDALRGSVLPQFHLLFRTNVFSGYEETFRTQLPNWLDYRLSFKWLREHHADKAVFHYTDTPQLSAQYKVLTDENFAVLPVPVPWMPNANAAAEESGPLNIVYVGDVRDEKGYQFYPQIIEGLWNDLVVPGRIRFTLQSNFADNLDVSRDSAVAQSVLRTYPESIVCHVKGPMDSAAYRDLVESADIILLTYKPDHYLARSSGIFIEAMKAGKAVLMPATTWMAAEVEPMRQAKWRSLIEGHKPAFILSGAQWGVLKHYELPGLKHGAVAIDMLFDKTQNFTGFVELALHKRDKDKNIVDSSITIVQMDTDGRATFLVPVGAMAGDQTLSYKTHGLSVGLKNASVHILDDLPPGALDYAAAIYPYQDAPYMVGRLRELVANIEAYKTEAREFAAKRGGYFTPETLVEGILSRAGGKA